MAKTGAERVRDSMNRKREQGWRTVAAFIAPEVQKHVEQAQSMGWTLGEMLLHGARELKRCKKFRS